MKAILPLLMTISIAANAETLLLKVNKNFKKEQIKGELTRFTNYKSEYFSNLYHLETKQVVSNSDLMKLRSMKGVESVERTSSITTTSIDPADISTRKTSDPLYVYQWGYDFQNQKVYNEVNDLENLLIKGNKKADIGVSNLKDISKKFHRDVIVAVIDTGVDYNHPDLKDNIFKNEVECENGEIPFDPETSNDDNEYKGDCKGWDFTGKEKPGTNRPEDFVGHGSHIAGIISAVKDNGIGLGSVSNKIKILPIKVLSNKAEDSQALGTSDRLSKAILYAVSMKADVINLSLGWPLSFDKDHLREAVKEAVNKGVTVVAAAGNNDHSEPIMPCAYEGVICVGSNDPNTSMSDFSNFGAHVDVLAPGNNILSTIPTANTPLFFDQNGYEIKSGTSQAAPYVSALIATIKGTHKDISEEQMKAKLLGGARTPYKTKAKFASGSIINFERSLNFDDVIIKPSFKGFNRVRMSLTDNSFQFEIGLSRYGTKVKKVKLKVRGSNDMILDQEDFNLTDENKITVSGKMKSSSANVLQAFKLSVNYAKKTEEYQFEKRFYIDFSEVKEARKFEIMGANPKSISQMATLNYHHTPYDFPYYYTTTDHKQGTILSLFTKQRDKVMNIGTTLIKDVSTIISIHRLDANFDGKADILVRSLLEKKDEEGNITEQTVQYSYLTEKLRPLFFESEDLPDGKKRLINFSNMKLKFEGVILEDLNDFALTKVKYDRFGDILVPVYTKYGDNPEADRNPNPFARLRRRVFSAKIFYYLPELNDKETTLVTRTINNNKFTDNFKRKIGFRPFEQMFVVKFAKQTYEDIKKGQFSLLISHESERKLARNYVLKFNSVTQGDWTIDRLGGQSLNLSEFVTERAFDLDASSILSHVADLQIIGHEKSSSLSWEEYSVNKGRIDYVSIIQDNVFDTLEYPIKTYLKGAKTYRFFQTPSRIHLEVEMNQRKKKYSYPVHISSFLPGMLFREQHYPMSFVDKGEVKPALYVDSTQIASRNIYMITLSDEKIYAPIRFNINIPEKCKALNPVIIDQYKYEYSIQCFGERGKSELIYIPVEVN